MLPVVSPYSADVGRCTTCDTSAAISSLLLQLPRRVATATIRAAAVVATLGDVLLTRCSGSSLRVNLLPTHLVGELAAELRGHGATKSALATIGSCVFGSSVSFTLS